MYKYRNPNSIEKSWWHSSPFTQDVLYFNSYFFCEDTNVGTNFLVVLSVRVTYSISHATVFPCQCNKHNTYHGASVGWVCSRWLSNEVQQRTWTTWHSMIWPGCVMVMLQSTYLNFICMVMNKCEKCQLTIEYVKIESTWFLVVKKNILIGEKNSEIKFKLWIMCVTFSWDTKCSNGIISQFNLFQ